MVVCDLLRMALIAVPRRAGTPLWAVFAVLVLVGLLAPPFDAARSSLCADLLTGEHYVVGNALTTPSARPGSCSASSGRHASSCGWASAAPARRRTQPSACPRAAGLPSAQRAPSCPSSTRSAGRPAGARRSQASRCCADAAPAPAAVLGPAQRDLAVIAPEGLAVAIAEEDGRGPFVAGLLTASVPAGFLIGSWLVLRLPAERREPLFPVLVTASCLPLLLTAVIEDAVVLCAVWVLAGVGNALQLVANSAFVQAVPAHLRGRAFGVAGTLLMAVQGAVLLLAGALAEVTGPRAPVALVAACTLLLVPFLVAAQPSSRQSAEVA
jgi:hypothetical protein